MGQFRPPMGWNSWDCYGAAVTEKTVRENAAYMAEHLRRYGWEYIVVDIQWYEPNAKSHEYNAYAELCMDQYSRLIPAPNRFPSAADGKGFKPLADYVHSLGLKFGIHMLRGIPRQAVHRDTPILGSGATARGIAKTDSICAWNTDMYGVNTRCEAAQLYYDSIFEMYAQWGVDFVKVDDIANTEFQPHNPYSAKEEIEMIRRAIDKCGRDIVLSLSPGPAQLSAAQHLCQNANMWRLTGDFWDDWDKLYDMFSKTQQWYGYVSEGCWPDCDMLPLGNISINGSCHGAKNRYTKFTKDEQITMMTLWCIFRSPLMFGGEMRNNDEWTLGLITNEEVLAVNQRSKGGRPVKNDGKSIVWRAENPDGKTIIALFNAGDEERTVGVGFDELEISGKFILRDLWKREDTAEVSEKIEERLRPHSAKLYLLK